ncbi:MAG TPA: ADP/ATP-dependent (S)-NAD(P)H-hydrate dehydratase, partial [Chloroflexota bacterium]|nr:ADP/ATP-dependent (S)-NAD(P)H-hydrate dehydratase [Chloroflexota bacterium]
ADALNALSRVPLWWEHLPSRSVITPHPGEMARLTGEPIDAIQRDRLGIASRYAARWSTTVLLKGAATVVAGQDGALAINPTGSANLATAGTGDVLTGTIGGLLAQGLNPWGAAVLGAYWHGAAGDVAAARHGRAGTLAGGLPALLPRARELILRQGGMQ